MAISVVSMLGPLNRSDANEFVHSLSNARKLELEALAQTVDSHPV